jgi:hypothetical protein
MLNYPIWIKEIKQHFDLPDLVCTNTIIMCEVLNSHDTLTNICYLYISICMLESHGTDVNINKLTKLLNIDETLLLDKLVHVLNNIFVII